MSRTERSIDAEPFKRYTLLVMAVLKLDNLSRRAGGKWTLWDVNLEVAAGEILGILGRSDSGKTALARVMAGVDEPTSGSISVSGVDEAKPVHVSIGLSTPALALEMTVYENLDTFAALWGVGRRQRTKQAAFLLELLNLSDYRSARVEHLSSGAAKRLEIARAIIADSPVTVIDSLLDNLDTDILEKLWDYLLSLRRNDLKAIVVLTGVGRVAQMCNKLAVIHRGRINFIGRPEDFRRMAGEDMVVLGDVTSPEIRNRLREQISLEIKEEDGFSIVQGCLRRASNRRSALGVRLGTRLRLSQAAHFGRCAGRAHFRRSHGGGGYYREEVLGNYHADPYACVVRHQTVGQAQVDLGRVVRNTRSDSPWTGSIPRF